MLSMNKNEANVADPLLATSVSQRAQCLGNPIDANCKIAICFFLHKLLWQHELEKILI